VLKPMRNRCFLDFRRLEMGWSVGFMSFLG